MKIKCTFLFAIFVWKFRAEAWAWARAWVGAWVGAPATIGIGYDQGRRLPDISKPQGRCVDSYRPEETWHRAAAPASQL